MTWQLRDAVSGIEIPINSIVTTYRNDPVRVLGLFPPRTMLSGLGRVQVERVEKRGNEEITLVELVAPSVIGASFVTHDMDDVMPSRMGLVNVNLPEAFEE